MGRLAIAVGLLILVMITLIVNLRAVSECQMQVISVPAMAAFKAVYDVDLQECKRKSIWDYSCLNDFFTRELDPHARSIDAGVVSPVDGSVEQAGIIEDGLLVQAKGKLYDVDELVGPGAGDILEGGVYATLYLAPYNYHRVHMPMDGLLLATKRIAGRSLPVNALAVNNVNGLYAQNERVVMMFETTDGAIFFMVLVGALFVDSINHASDLRLYHKGEDVGKFNFGSTVILLLSPEVSVSSITAKKRVCMGDTLAL
jgi:phosphatidylserine decarboxylase